MFRSRPRTPATDFVEHGTEVTEMKMHYVLIIHAVKDYSAWKQVFDGPP